jgi:hypothetical protein
MKIGTDPIAPSAARMAVAATALVLSAALIGAAVRLLPWVLDPQIPWATLAPFAKSLLAVAVEAAILTGWPVGWALAAQRLSERGEARVLASLGESPERTLVRLAPQAALFALILAGTSALLGREAAAPGRVVNALLMEGRAACIPGKTHGVPFVSATWLCTEREPRLVGRAPIGGVVFTATNAKVSDDLRRIELDDARLALPMSGGGPGVVRVQTENLVLRGLAPWARASAVPPALRALVVTLSAIVAGAAAALAILRVRRRRIGTVAASAIGAAGPLGALAALRGLELRVPELGEPYHGLFLALLLLVPLVSLGAVVASAAVVTLLPEARRTDSK